MTGPSRGRSDSACVLVAHPSSELYGSDRVMLESVDGFVARGWRVVVTVPGDGPLLAELEARGVELRFCPTPTLRRSYLRGIGPLRLAGAGLGALAPGVRLLRSVRPDAVYVSTLTIPLWFVLARALRVPSLGHVHEAEGTAPRSIRILLALPLVLARRIVVNSRFSAEVLRSALPSLGARANVVYNGVPGPPEAVTPRPEIAGAVRLLYLGRLSERKGVLDALEAVALLTGDGTDAVLDVVGAVFPGYEWFEESLRQRATEADLADRVRLRGFDTDIWPYLGWADVLLVPSRTDEPFGNTAVEGALAARPVIASTSGGLTEAIEGMQASRGTPPGDPTALADAVRQIVSDWAQVRELAIEDSQRAARRHSPMAYREAIAGELERVMR